MDVGALSPAKRALLEQAIRRRRDAAGAAAAIPRRIDTGPVPLSSTQRRMWFFQQWAPEAPTFNAARAIRLRGKLDRDALRRALAKVIERHESLRTIVRPGPEPLQVVIDSWSLELGVISNLARGDAQALHRLLRELAREPFDLTADLMLRATLIELGPGDHVLLLRIHHIAADAHSDGILFAELSEAYSAYREGREPALPELSVQYADFTVWQHARLAGPLLDELISYWRVALDGAPPLLELPTDRPRPPVQRHAGAHRQLSLDRALAERLIEVGRPQGATFFMSALAAFATLLYQRTGAGDLVIGSPIANRNYLELHPVVGFFSNTIALRLRLDGNPTFRDVLTRARETALGAYAHQDLPFEKLVEVVAPKRDPRYNPIFQVNLRAQATDRPTLELSGLATDQIPVDIGFSRFDLALELELGPDSLAGYFEYDEDLFEPATIDGLIEDLALLLTQVTADPEAPILTIKLPSRTTGRSGPRISRRRHA
jgi:Condensation domain